MNAMKGNIPKLIESNGEDIFGIHGASVTDAITSASKEALSRMPIPDINVLQRSIGYSPDECSRNVDCNYEFENAAAEHRGTKVGDILDLEDIFSTAGANILSSPGKADSSGLRSDIELLSDIFSAPPTSSTSNSMSLTD